MIKKKSNVPKEQEGKTPNHSTLPLTWSAPIAANTFLSILPEIFHAYVSICICIYVW